MTDKQWDDLKDVVAGKLLDPLPVGFISREQFEEFGLPYFKELYHRDLSIKFLHNDANCMESVEFLPDLGVNLFNMGFDTDLNLLKELTGNQVTMLGNIPPRDVLARGSTAEVASSVNDLLDSLQDRSRIVFSCGGGMSPGVPTENIQAFIQTLRKNQSP